MPRSRTYSYTNFDDPDAVGIDGSTFARGVNNDGQVVGYYSDGTRFHGFLYSAGTYVTLDDPAGGAFGQTNPEGINANGQIVGWFNDRSSDHAFLYSDGSYTTLKDLGTVNTFAVDINLSGQIVGYYQDGTLNGGLVNHGFLYTGGTYIRLDDPFANNPSVSSGTANGTVATGMNDKGQIVGYYYDSNERGHGFLYSHGSYTTLDDPLGTNGTFATDINDKGQIVGYYYDNLHNQHGFLYDGRNYTTLDDPVGINSTYATGINDNGQIVGSYGNGSHGFVASPLDGGADHVKSISSLHVGDFYV
jgi:probable HAF family extracellular repeat protein